MISLQRGIQVRTFEAEATVAIGRDRPEFLAVARLAADLDHPIDGRDIARELLGNLPEQVGWRVLERALALGLLEREGHRGPAVLSDSGRTMLEDGSVLVPEEGVWRFFIVEDDLVSTPLVHVRRLDTENAKTERDRLYKRGRGDRPESGRLPPTRLTSMERMLLRSVVDGRGFEVRDLGERGEDGPSSELVVSLQWAAGKAPEVWLRGRLPFDEGGKAEPVDLALPIPAALGRLSYDDVWVALVSSATGVREDHLSDWQERAGALVLPTNMGGWSSAVRRSFLADLQIPAVSIADIGRFDDARLEGVPLVAESDTAAQQWAEWLLWDSISTYVVPSDIDRARQAVRGQFPLHRPSLPDDGELLQRARSTPREKTARFLLAPADLGLWS